MKPPARRRSAPTRFEVEEGAVKAPARTLRLAWTLKEKMELLRGLKAQSSEKVPLPIVRGRSQSEVSAYIAWLRGRAAREAIQTEYKKWVREKKEKKSPAHIEVWTDLVCRMSSPAEEAISAAFSQVLTIASTEPVTIHYSAPTKRPQAAASKSNTPSIKPSQRKRYVEAEPASSGEAPPGVEEEQTDDPWKKLSFENIYKYLSRTAKGETLPKLAECESAVLLHLLNCLPDQLRTLNAWPLGACLRKTYTYMNSCHESKDSPQEEKEKEDAPPDSQEPNWKEIKFCPLNPFLLPVELLQPKAEP